MESNTENPLAFYEYIINEHNICIELDKRLLYSDFTSYIINLPDEIKYVEQIEFGEYKEGILILKNEFIPILRLEFEKSKKLILEKYFTNDEISNRNFLRYLFNILQSLVNDESKIINKYPYLILAIRGFISFINKKLLYHDMEKFILIEDGLEKIDISDDYNTDKSNIEIMHSVLDYMKGLNEKQSKILTDEDYNLLIEYTTHLIEKEEVPEILKILKPDLIKDTIRFSFWVLHHEIYTTKRIKNYFYNFIKLVFEKFENDELISIKKHFGTKSRVPNDKFLPPIIRNNLMKKS